MTIWLTHISCWLTNTTHIFTLCNTYCCPTATIVGRKRPTITSYVYCRFVIVHTQFIDVAAGLIIQSGGPRVEYPCCGPYLQVYLTGQPTCSYKGFISKKLLLNNLPLSRSLFGARSVCVSTFSFPMKLVL